LQPWQALLDQDDWRVALSAAAAARGVVSGGGAPICFVDADAAGATAYEIHIHATGRVPTRANRHDLFNALTWLALPRAKAALNARQAEQLLRDGVGARRGPVRDAATLIDESGLLLATDDSAVWAALQAHDWAALFGSNRDRWGRSIRCLIFGHAVLDKLGTPYKGLTVAVLPLPYCASVAEFDVAAACFIGSAALAPRQLPHLPVLGIPGWWPANEAPGFYDDAAVFRPARGAA
jgi:hypothetical protein